MDQILKTLNMLIEGNNKNLIPAYLYKYRPFDKFTFDMLENNYLYLCPAKKLDDPTECDVIDNTSAKNDININNLKFIYINMLLEKNKPLISETLFNHIKKLIYSAFNKGNINFDYILQISLEIKKIIPEFDDVAFANCVNNVCRFLDNGAIQEQIFNFIFFAKNAKENLGICSLTELFNCDRFWKDYANDSTGYCIEYKMDEYKFNNSIFPVVYSDDRNKDIIECILDNLTNNYFQICSFYCGDIDKTQFIRLFLTKNLNWKHQKERRILGEANERIEAPKISKIILGKNVSEKDKNNMIRYCEKNKIKLEYK